MVGVTLRNTRLNLNQIIVWWDWGKCWDWARSPPLAFNSFKYSPFMIVFSSLCFNQTKSQWTVVKLLPCVSCAALLQVSLTSCSTMNHCRGCLTVVCGSPRPPSPHSHIRVSVPFRSSSVIHLPWVVGDLKQCLHTQETKRSNVYSDFVNAFPTISCTSLAFRQVQRCKVNRVTDTALYGPKQYFVITSENVRLESCVIHNLH
jgi:hypothetical protein